MGLKKGLRLKHRLVKVFNWCVHRRTRRRSTATFTYHRLQSVTKPISILHNWVCSLKAGSRKLSAGKGNSSYIRIGKEPVGEEFKLPKGHLAVYVGDGEVDACRVLVPVIYFNHPLFSELLREAEKVYGFDHPGGIQIPCPKSELENIQMKIAAVIGGGSWRRRRNL